MREPRATGPMTPADLPDTATVYVPGFGETTVGALRASEERPTGSDAETIRMWGYIATHPKARPWKEGWPRRV